MSAEQHHHLPEHYFQTKEKAPIAQNSRKEEEVRQFDLYFSFQGIPELMQRFGPEKGLFQGMLGVALNIWSARQEMLGEIDTRELITLITFELDHTLRFQNDLFGQAKDLRAMYETGIQHVPIALRPRYRREADQAIKVFETVTSPLSAVDFSLPPKTLEEKLRSLGFHEEEIDISPSMVANIESLRNQIQTIEELDQLIAKRPKMRAFVGPSKVLSASPSHWSHHRGETIFTWVSECVVLPETKEVFIRQNGKFGKGKDENLLPYLSYGKTELPAFQSEEELMQFMNVILETDYRQPKVLLDFLVSTFKGIKPAGKIDCNIKSGELDIQPYFLALKDLFAFELGRIGKDPLSKIAQRLGDFSEKVKHQIARNEPKALNGLVNKYTVLVKDNPQLLMETFREQMNSTALSLDKGFNISIDFSLFECVAGSPMSIVSNMESIASIKASLGEQNFAFLQQLDVRKEGLTKAELKLFCKAFGKDASKYSTRGECALCHKQTYIWSSENGGCNVCPVCEVKDDLGLTGHSLDEDQSEGSARERSEHVRHSSEKRMGISDFVAGLGNPHLVWQTFLIDLLAKDGINTRKE